MTTFKAKYRYDHTKLEIAEIKWWIANDYLRDSITAAYNISKTRLSEISTGRLYANVSPANYMPNVPGMKKRERVKDFTCSQCAKTYRASGPGQGKCPACLTNNGRGFLPKFINGIKTCPDCGGKYLPNYKVFPGQTTCQECRKAAGLVAFAK